MAVTIVAQHKLAEYMGDATIDLDADTFTLQLHSALTFNASTHAVEADVSGTELSTANGYTAGGANLTSVTWVESSGTVTFDAADVSWTASGGSIAATDAVLFDNTVSSPVTDPIMFGIDFDGTETAGDTTDFVVAWNASGIFTSAFA